MRTKSIYVEPLLFGYMFCIYLLNPVEQQLVYQKVCLKHFNESYCEAIHSSDNEIYQNDQKVIQEETAQWEIYFDVARSLPAVFITIIYGAWSDHVGRKAVMILPIVGELASSIVFLICSMQIKYDLQLLFLGIIISGCFGNFACIISVSFSYVADRTDQASRTRRVVILESMIYLGGVFSNFIGGLILQYYGFVTIYVLVTTIYLLLCIYWLFLEESYTPQTLKKDMFKILFDTTHLRESWNLLTMKERKFLRPIVFLYLCCVMFLVAEFVTVSSVSVLYTLHPPLNFSPSYIGYFFGEMNALKALGAWGINFLVIKKLQCRDSTLIFISCICYSLMAISLASATEPWHMFLALAWCIGMGVGTSAARAGLSKLVSSADQGKIFSIVACLEVAVVLISGPVASELYKETLSITNKFSYYLLTGFGLIPVLLTFGIRRYQGSAKYNQLLEKETSDTGTQNETTSSTHSINQNENDVNVLG